MNGGPRPAATLQAGDRNNEGDTMKAKPGPFTGVGRRIAKHGTSSGYQAHINYGTEPCDECRKARAEYNRQWRQKQDNKAAEAR